MTREELKHYRDKISELVKRYHATNIRMFGSTVRDDNTPESDVDFLIDVSPKQTLLDLIAFTHELKELLSCEVDVAQSTLLHPVIRDEVLRETVSLEYIKELLWRKKEIPAFSD
ncbi:MAG: nucleotidyltransferase family protein [Pleurocapsa sp.]